MPHDARIEAPAGTTLDHPPPAGDPPPGRRSGGDARGASASAGGAGAGPCASRFRRMRSLLPVALLVPFAALAATMSTRPVETTPPLMPGEEVSAARGHFIVVGGGPNGAGSACFSCHGSQGQGDAGGAFPRLAGIGAQYLARRMEDYASGTRPNAVMTPIAQALSRADRRSVALYYAGLPAGGPTVGPATVADARSVQWGATLYAQGSAERGIQACANCHGPNGQGLEPHEPAHRGPARILRRGATAVLARGHPAQRHRRVHGRRGPADDGRRHPRRVGLRRRTRAVSRRPRRLLVALAACAGLAACDLSETDAAARNNKVVQGGDAARGRAIVASGEYGCAACHTIPGIRAPRVVVGPALHGVAHRGLIAGRLPNTPAVLVAFLADPPALAPETGMPDVGLTLDQARHVAAYLYTLESTPDVR